MLTTLVALQAVRRQLRDRQKSVQRAAEMIFELMPAIVVSGSLASLTSYEDLEATKVSLRHVYEAYLMRSKQEFFKTKGETR